MGNKRISRIHTLEHGLSELDDQLGFSTAANKIRTRRQRRQDTHSRIIVAHAAKDMARSILYAPDMDGHADPGEVVHVRFTEENSDQAAERQVLVVGRQGHTLLGTLISTNEDHANETNWVAIGSDSFSHGKPSWVRVDRVLEIPESGIRRDGSIMPARRFAVVARALRLRHGWS
ncbi:type II toxin-antitoxin system PemK/MazF family toxin [Corynebacterium ulceribovis]|uniref:type II toxin-antitoxin system PemK/MazF family toxin n=1 Tax=Corynebacterium ulceribovis TaxID=487732 RepID=UPI00039DF33E|nr:type II toxin-antitoxin system PemK/MazF family toxin [Corynebacterium ulceribovis]